MTVLNMDYKARRYITNSVVVSSILIFVLIITAVVIDKKLFIAKKHYTTKFKDAAGLSSSTPVLYKSYEIGRVKSFYLNDNDNVVTEILIYNDFAAKLKTGSVLVKILNPISGSGTIHLNNQNAGENIIGENSEIISSDFLSSDIMPQMVTVNTSGELLYSTLINLNNILTDLNTNTNNQGSVLFATVYNLAEISGILRDLAPAITKLTVHVQNEVEDSSSTFNSAMTSIRLLSTSIVESTDDLSEIIKNLKELTKTYNNTDGLLANMIDPSGEQLITPLNSFIKNSDTLITQHRDFVNFLNSERGNLKVLLQELETLSTQLKKTVNSLNSHPLLFPTEQDSINTGTLNIRPMIDD